MIYFVLVVVLTSMIVFILNAISRLRYSKFKKYVDSLILADDVRPNSEWQYGGVDRRAKKRAVPVYLGSGRGWVFR